MVLNTTFLNKSFSMQLTSYFINEAISRGNMTFSESHKRQNLSDRNLREGLLLKQPHFFNKQYKVFKLTEIFLKS